MGVFEWLHSLWQRFGRAAKQPILVVASHDAHQANNQSIIEYQITNGIGPNGNVAPTWIITGPNTTLKFPAGIAVHARKIYVADRTANSITVFPVATGGNLTPLFNISGSNTLLSNPYPIAIDKSGNLFVAGTSAGTSQITVYKAGVSGNVAPMRHIAGNNTRLSGVITGIAVDRNGRIYALNAFAPGGRVTVYAPGATGNVAPIRTIEGARTKLGAPQGMALDLAGQIYVTNNPAFSSENIVVFAPDASGDVAPTAVITGSQTGLGNNPSAIMIGLGGKIYVVNQQFATAVSVFPAGANGNVAPLAMLAGSATGIVAAYGLAMAYRR